MSWRIWWQGPKPSFYKKRWPRDSRMDYSSKARKEEATRRWIGAPTYSLSTIPSGGNNLLSDNAELVVDKQVLLTFSIGKYVDDVLCDMVPIEVVHVFLGRPWQYDRDVVHNGVTNQYSFLHKGQKVVHSPLSPSEVWEDQIKKRLKREKENQRRKRSFEREKPKRKRRQKEWQERTKEKRKKEWKIISDKREFIHQT